MGTPLRAHYSSRAFNYRVVLLLRDWYFLPSCPPSLHVLPPFVSFLPLCPSSLRVLPPFLSVFPSCLSMRQSLSFSTYSAISSLCVGAVHSASPPLPSHLISPHEVQYFSPSLSLSFVRRRHRRRLIFFLTKINKRHVPYIPPRPVGPRSPTPCPVHSSKTSTTCPPSSFVFSLEDAGWPKLFPNNTFSTIDVECVLFLCRN